MTDDLLRRADAWLRQCPSCDIGLLKACVCPPGDIRAVIADLVDEVVILRQRLTSCVEHSALVRHQLNLATGKVSA